MKKAIEEKLAILKEAKIQNLVDASIGINIVGCKWIFKSRQKMT